MSKRSIAARPRSLQAKRTPALGRPVRPARSQHERQAEDSAARFARGEPDIGHRLTPAPASVLHFPLSPARRLPRNLREALEQSFVADLGGLRLHTDAVAGSLAQSLGARAFTAGASIYFGPGAWSPHSTEGRYICS